MRFTLTILTTIILSGSSCSQSTEFETYVNSFKMEKTGMVLNFGRVVQVANRMTKQEALAYVYNGDSSKLFCHQEIFNMETEKTEGVSTELYLPDKCLKLDMDGYFLIAYSSYECQDPKKLLTITLTIKILDKRYKSTDTMLAYKGTDYDWEMTGLINPQNGKIFVIKQMDLKTQKKQALIYRVNNSLQFEIEKQQSNIENMTDDLEKNVELLSWKEVFLN